MKLEEYLRGGFAQMGLTLDEDMLRRYRIYCDYLAEINAVMNLTAIEGEENTAKLHFLDCAALLTMENMGGKRLIDVGSGAGFPGLALKIACPELKLTLLDSLDKRVNFLSETCKRLGFDDVKCVHARAEEFAAAHRESFDIATSRAVASLPLLSELCLPLVKPGGWFLAMKSVDSDQELQSAARAIATLGGEVVKSENYQIPGIGVSHRVIFIKKIKETPKKYPRPFAKIKKNPL